MRPLQQLVPVLPSHPQIAAHDRCRRISQCDLDTIASPASRCIDVVHTADAVPPLRSPSGRGRSHSRTFPVPELHETAQHKGRLLPVTLRYIFFYVRACHSLFPPPFASFRSSIPREHLE